jgi:hypothetical protein
MSLPLLLLFAVAAIGFSMFAIYSLIYAGFIAYARARRKGYHSVGASLVIGLSGIGWLAVFVVALAWANSLTFASSFTLALASPFFGIAMMFLIVWLLPRRQVRVFGPRRGGRTLVIVGWITALGGGIPTMLVLLFVMPTVESIRDVFLAGGLLCCGALFWFFPGYVLVRVGKTAERQPRLEAVLTKDVRPPILYLRPFGRERQPFVTGDSAKYGAYYRGTDDRTPACPSSFRSRATSPNQSGRTLGRSSPWAAPKTSSSRSPRRRESTPQTPHGSRISTRSPDRPRPFW